MSKRQSLAEKAKARISAKQQLALEVLLVGGTDQQAADAARVSRTTVSHWRRQVPDFVEAARLARRDLLQRMSSRLHAATTYAVKALEELAKDPAAASTRGAAARVSAARSIIELSQKAYETDDLEVRLHEIEEQMKETRAHEATGRGWES